MAIKANQIKGQNEAVNVQEKYKIKIITEFTHLNFFPCLVGHRLRLALVLRAGEAVDLALVDAHAEVGGRAVNAEHVATV